MNPLIQFKTRTLPLLTAVLLNCLALSPEARALNPPPDGGYPFATTAEGDGALGSLTLSGKGRPTAVNNTALGFDTLFNNTGGNSNTATGARALFDNITGSANTATGYQALFHNTVSGNTADGFEALNSNTTGPGNSATGYQALYHNTTGNGNTADGYQALFHNTVDGNTADGYQALLSNTIGGNNTATGWEALHDNTIGGSNTATGWEALLSNTSGGGNTATGQNALHDNTTGKANTAMGNGALYGSMDGSSNTAVGAAALLNLISNSNPGRPPVGNTAIGTDAGINLFVGDGNIYIGDEGTEGSYESDTIRIGAAGLQTATYIAGIYGNEFIGSPVVVKSDGQLGVGVGFISSARFKDEIKPMDKTSEAILALKPVTFRYKKDLDPKSIPQFGLVAEDVEKVNPDLVARDRDGKPYTVRYEAVNAMLLNEFLKEHAAFLEERRKVHKLEGALEAVNKRLKEQDAKIDKVDAKVELSRPVPQVAVNGSN
jgi:hypothetical protein